MILTVAVQLFRVTGRPHTKPLILSGVEGLVPLNSEQLRGCSYLEMRGIE